MIIETSLPDIDAVRRAVEDYTGQYPEFADVLRMYGAIMEAQLSALEGMTCPLEPLGPEERDRRLSLGEPLMDLREVRIEGGLFRRLVGEICRAVESARPGLALCGELASWEGLADERIEQTRDAVLEGKDPGFAPRGEAQEDGPALVASILWESLAPFYMVCDTMLASGMDQSLWQRGYCPVCGGPPLIGKYRQDDGLWIVECSLCHTNWNLQRASCPFCEGRQGSLDYLYLDEDTKRRVNYCEVCKRYVKTVDARDGDENVLLPLEDLVTVRLDMAARQEGLLPASAVFAKQD